MEQDKDIYQDMDNVHDNPYNKDYQEYMAGLREAKKEITKPRRIASIILCSFSTGWIFLTSFFWVLLYLISNDNGSPVTSAIIMFFLFCVMLIPAVIAKIVNRKSKWALIDIICTCIVLVVVMITGIICPPWN